MVPVYRPQNLDYCVKNNFSDWLKKFFALGKQHCTSKLSSIDDFNSLTSFGFRGEGLNALASLR